MVWPPGLDDLKNDLELPLDDTSKDATLRTQLDAAIVFVERLHGDLIAAVLDESSPVDESPDESSEGRPDPLADIKLGTLRLARRWNDRKRSPDGLVQMAADLGSGRVPSFDPDIDRLLRIGKYRGPVFA